jgi:hypothetical protein
MQKLTQIRRFRSQNEWSRRADSGQMRRNDANMSDMRFAPTIDTFKERKKKD